MQPLLLQPCRLFAAADKQRFAVGQLRRGFKIRRQPHAVFHRAGRVQPLDGIIIDLHFRVQRLLLAPAQRRRVGKQRCQPPLLPAIVADDLLTRLVYAQLPAAAAADQQRHLHKKSLRLASILFFC